MFEVAALRDRLGKGELTGEGPILLIYITYRLLEADTLSRSCAPAL